MDLTTRYLGLTLTNPLVASAGPIAETVAGVRRLAAAGVGAVVLPSLFEEQIRYESLRDAGLADTGADSHPEAANYLPIHGWDAHPHDYLNLIESAAGAVDLPVIGSINGVTSGGMTRYAKAMQRAGAAAIELNIYPMLRVAPYGSGREAERRHLDIVRAVREAVTIPIAVKLGPYFSSLGELATALDDAGADGLVLFNRFMQADIDPESLSVTAKLRLSHPAEAGLPRSWIARLHGRVRASLAASTGVEQGSDVAAYLLAGADVVMTTSALLRHGPDYAGVLLDQLRSWIERQGFPSLAYVRGRLADVALPGRNAYGRPGYLDTIDVLRRRYRSGAAPLPTPGEF